MTLRHMKIFLAVYQTQHITKAAQQLRMTQPAVTRAIQEIESYYGIRLFERINRKLYITQTGTMFYTYAVHIVDSFDQMEKGLRDWDQLGLLPGWDHHRPGYRPAAPGADALSAVPPQPADPLRGVQRRGPSASSAGQRIGLCRDGGKRRAGGAGPTGHRPRPRLVLILPPDDPRAGQERLELKDLAQDSLLLRDKGSVGRAFVERVFAMHELPLVPTMESVSTQAIIQAVHLGLGISFLPERLVSGAVQSGLVATKELCDETFERENYIVWHRHKFLTSSAQELMDCFDQMSGELPIATGSTTSLWKPPTATIAPPLSAASPENNIYR